MIYSHFSQEKDGICFRKVVTAAWPQSENKDNPDTPRLHCLKPWETEAETQVQPVSRRGGQNTCRQETLTQKREKRVSKMIREFGGGCKLHFLNVKSQTYLLSTASVDRFLTFLCSQFLSCRIGGYPGNFLSEGLRCSQAMTCVWEYFVILLL